MGTNYLDFDCFVSKTGVQSKKGGVSLASFIWRSEKEADFLTGSYRRRATYCRIPILFRYFQLKIYVSTYKLSCTFLDSLFSHEGADTDCVKRNFPTKVKFKICVCATQSNLDGRAKGEHGCSVPCVERRGTVRRPSLQKKKRGPAIVHYHIPGEGDLLSGLKKRNKKFACTYHGSTYSSLKHTYVRTVVGDFMQNLEPVLVRCSFYRSSYPLRRRCRVACAVESTRG